MRARRSVFGSLLVTLASFPLLAQRSLPPKRVFGPDTTSTGVFTGAGTPLGLACTPSVPPMECSGFLASDVDGTALDVTVRIPADPAPHPLVVNLHGYGGSKHSDSAWDEKLLSRGYAVLRYSAHGFGKSWGQVNLADLNVELRDLRSMIAQAIEDPQVGPRLNPDAVAVLGASYGGGQSWLAALQPQFATPAGKTIRVRTIVPIVPWTDLVGALRPNGDLADSIDPPGSYKLSYLEGLFAGGSRRDSERPYSNYPDYLLAWNAYILGTEPNNNLPPVGTQIVDGIAGYRSIWWQEQFFQTVKDNAKAGLPQLPVFELQGFTDDLFPLPEALRMYRALKRLDPAYPIAEYLGDVGHPRAANKQGEVDYALDRVFEWLDFHLKGAGTVSYDVLAAVTRPASVSFDGADVLRVASVDDLATGSATEYLPGDAVLTFDPANLGGLFSDPFVFTGCEQLQPVCAAPPPDVVPGDVATYVIPAAKIASDAGLAAGPFLVAGQLVVSFHASTSAYRVQLDVRLYDVTPTGQSTLMTRGTSTLDSGSPLAPLGDANVDILTYGNLMQVASEDSLRLEIANVDSPYITPSRVPSVTRLSKASVTVPMRPPFH